MIGLTIAEYLISEHKAKRLLKQNTALIKTIVSSNMTDQICKYNGVKLFETLTGFKNIASVMRRMEQEGKYVSIMGYEESYGCLVGTYARDKDGIIAVMLLCEAAAYYKIKGMTLWDKMKEMYEKYGYYQERQISVVLEGAEGAQKIKEMMDNLRNNPPAKLADFDIIGIKDVKLSTYKNVKTGEIITIDLPKSNVLYYEMENDYWCAVRPSGTEPKIKFYIGVKGTSLQNAEEELNKLEKGIQRMMK